MKRRFWADSDFNFIKQHSTQLSNRQIGEALGRTEVSISHKIHKLNLNRVKPVVIKNCLYCTKPFRVHPRSIKRGGGKYCSRNCLYLHYYIDENKGRRLFDEWEKSRLPIRLFSLKIRVAVGRLIKVFKEYFPDEYEIHIEGQQNANKKYHKGRQFEYMIRNLYIKKGYFVLRSPRSLGLVDIVAIKKGEILFIQCKLGGAMSQLDRKNLILLAESVGAKALLATKDRINRKGIILKDLTNIQ